MVPMELQARLVLMAPKGLPGPQAHRDALVSRVLPGPRDLGLQELMGQLGRPVPPVHLEGPPVHKVTPDPPVRPLLSSGPPDPQD